jgi:hypothetical protein
MSDFFDWLSLAPGSATAASPRGFNNLGLIGAGLSDLASNARGRPGDAVASFGNALYQQGLMQRQIAARQSYARAMQSGDPAAQLAARAQLFASGAIPANYAFPQIQHGFVVSPDGAQAQAIPGGPADPRVVAQRWAARRGQVLPANQSTAQPSQPSQFYSHDENGNPVP